MTSEQQAVEEALRMLESDDAVSLIEWHRAGKVVAAEVRRLREDEIRRLRRALREIANPDVFPPLWSHIRHLKACKCASCIATRALKGRG